MHTHEIAGLVFWQLLNKGTTLSKSSLCNNHLLIETEDISKCSQYCSVKYSTVPSQDTAVLFHLLEPTYFSGVIFNLVSHLSYFISHPFFSCAWSLHISFSPVFPVSLHRCYRYQHHLSRHLPGIPLLLLRLSQVMLKLRLLPLSHLLD